MTDHRPEVRECLLEYMALADKICYTEPELSQYHVMKAKAKAALSVAESPSVREALKECVDALTIACPTGTEAGCYALHQAKAALGAGEQKPVVDEVVEVRLDEYAEQCFLPSIDVTGKANKGDRVRIVGWVVER